MRHVTVVAALVGLLAAGGCGDSGTGTNPSPGTESGSLNETLAQLEAYPTPAGVDPSLFATLKAELKRVLCELDPTRSASAPPTVDYTRTPLAWDEGTSMLSWPYGNVGDYDQNGEVNIADLTPLGVHFNEQGPFDPNSVEAVIDGDSNGEINIADITPIGVHFGADATGGYNVYASTDANDYPADPEGASTIPPLDHVACHSALGEAWLVRLRFEYQVAEPEAEEYYWIRPVDYWAAEGTVSNIVGGPADPPALALTNPPDGSGTEEDKYRADVEVLYVFSVVDPVDGDVSLDPQTNYYVSDPAAGSISNLDAALDINDNFRGTFRVTAVYRGKLAQPILHFSAFGNTPPYAVLSADPIGGDAPLLVELDASYSSDPDGVVVSYDYDWEGDGTYDLLDGASAEQHTYIEQGVFNATVRVTDDDGAIDTAWVEISVLGGNQPPEANLAAEPTLGAAPLLVDFDASGSSDPEGSIASYDYDWEGDGIYDLTGASPSEHYTYSTPGNYNATLRVVDDGYAVDTHSVLIQVAPQGALPTAALTATPDSGTEPLEVLLDASGSTDDDGVIQKYEFDIDGNGSFEVDNGSDPQLTHVYNSGSYTAGVRVTDDDGWTDTATAQIEVSDDGKSWVTHDVDTDGNVGFWNVLALVDGNPAIAYSDDTPTTGGAVRYSRATDSLGTSWPAATTIKPPQGICEDVDLKVISGQPAVCFAEKDPDDDTYSLIYIRATSADGSTWGPRIVVDSNGSVGQYCTMLQVKGTAAIAYYDTDNSDLKYVREVGGIWGTPVFVHQHVDDVGAKPKLMLADGNPAIAYLNLTEHRVLFVRATSDTGAAWGSPVSVFTGDPPAALYPCLSSAVDPINGHPSLVFIFNSGIHYVQAASADGATWGTPHLIHQGQDPSDAPWALSLCFTGGPPAVAFSDSSTLMFALSLDDHGSAGSWTDPAFVDNLCVWYRYGVSLQPLGAGTFGISFHRYLTADLEYALYN